MSKIDSLSKPVFNMGQHTLEISMKLHIDNRNRLLERLKSKRPPIPDNTIILLQGGNESPRFCTDVNVATFRQESYFHWLFGVLEPGAYGAIDFLTGRSILFMPKLPSEYAIFMGEIRSMEYFRQRYSVNSCYFTDQLSEVLKEINENATLLTLRGINTDSGSITQEAKFNGIENFTVNNSDLLYNEITDLRVFKSDLEIEILRYCNRISSEAHKEVMRRVRPGHYEYQLESVFLNYCYSQGGMRHVAYTCICATGHNASVLHYGHAGAPNDKKLNESDMCLFDMGGEYYCYCSDITCSFPCGGKFSSSQKKIYEAVLEANRAVLSSAKPGVKWMDMHLLAERVILERLKDMKILTGDISGMMAVNLGATFMPHGLGHLMGLDVHDVGGYAPGHPLRSTKPGLRSLRTARILQPRMVLTIEPGIYFINHLIDEALLDNEKSKFIIPETINKFRGFGGVRIEDNVLITENGVELLTNVPRLVDEIEELMAQGRSMYGEDPIMKIFKE